MVPLPGSASTVVALLALLHAPKKKVLQKFNITTAVSVPGFQTIFNEIVQHYLKRRSTSAAASTLSTHSHSSITRRLSRANMNVAFAPASAFAERAKQIFVVYRQDSNEVTMAKTYTTPCVKAAKSSYKCLEGEA
jgi:cobalamin biosynthesis Mg chelatase CobN